MEMIGAISIMSDINSMKSAKMAIQIYGKKGLIKSLACGVGVSYIKKQYRYDGLQGHHSIPKNLGGHPTNQDLLYIPANTHRMFHWVLNLFLKMDPSLKGYGNWTSGTKWEEITKHKWGRIALYEAILKSSYVVDRVCKLRRPLRLRDYVRKYKKDFIEGAW